MQKTPRGRIVTFKGTRCYAIENVAQMPVFLMNIVSASDLWLFIASNGALTAGRRNADNAIFPYATADRICDSSGKQGAFTALWFERDKLPPTLWQPFALHTPRQFAVTHNLYKSIDGDRVWFEENNHDLGLTFRQSWTSADSHGLIREAEIENTAGTPCGIRILDSLRNLLMPGITQKLQNDYSYLADAYKTAARNDKSPLAIYALAAGIVDQPVAVAALRATAVWSDGLPIESLLLADAQLDEFLDDKNFSTGNNNRRRGERCAYGIISTLKLSPNEKRDWLIVADTGLSHTDIVALKTRIARGQVAAEIRASVEKSTAALRQLVASADGLQLTRGSIADAHHQTNVLFNILRGGVILDDSNLSSADFARFLRERNCPLAERCEAFLQKLPAKIRAAELARQAAATGDADLERLALEYLPLSFSRRHGDPSRPWNRFDIRVRDENGAPLLEYEGNWRDIFQNWEALGLSFPDFFANFAAKFLNASTADGFNPYRINRAGIDWEIPEPENPWAGIGYWGDHQVIYLLRLLEWLRRFDPDRIKNWLRRDIFAFAKVPYRITGYAAMRANPRETISFDRELHREIEKQLDAIGGDARLLRDKNGSVLHVNLVEKLLTLLLARLVNFIPGGGIWMNTQRPEWNDANNALVGNGVSLVTLCHLHRFLVFFTNNISPSLGNGDIAVTAPLAEVFETTKTILENAHPETATNDPQTRRAIVDRLGAAGETWREAVYAEKTAACRRTLKISDLAKFVETTRQLVDCTIRANRRKDGLFDSYNLLRFDESPPHIEIDKLPLMLEGQVAVLGAEILSPEESLALLKKLRASALWRDDQHSYLLYPDRELPSFLDSNRVPPDEIENCAFLKKMADSNNTRIIRQDAAGDWHFHPSLVNAAALDGTLSECAAPRQAAADVHRIYENVFKHREFTGRSGTMFRFEGLGCIYWHMVAKLLLAARENLALARNSQSACADELAAACADIRNGLGFCKTPAEYGAPPIDPYSHTPANAGAQQPGMTGQVKEEIITRLDELGVRIDGACARFAIDEVACAEFLEKDSVFEKIPVGAGELAFTFCGVPVIYRRQAAAARIEVLLTDGTKLNFDGDKLPHECSRELFGRTGKILRIDVFPAKKTNPKQT